MNDKYNNAYAAMDDLRYQIKSKKSHIIGYFNDQSARKVLCEAFKQVEYPVKHLPTDQACNQDFSKEGVVRCQDPKIGILGLILLWNHILDSLLW